MEKGDKRLYAGYFLFALYIILTTIGLLLIKMGGGSSHIGLEKGLFTFTMDSRLLIGMLSYMLSFLLFVVVLGKYNLSTIYPMAGGLVMICSVLAGVFLLKEQLHTVNIAGIALVVIGVVFLNIRR